MTRPKYEICVCSEHGQRADDETWCCHATRTSGGVHQCGKETEWIAVEPKGFEHGAVIPEDDAANARALARLAESFDPGIVRCDHGNFARGLAEIRGHGSFANGYELVSDLPALWEQTEEQRAEWERRRGVDNSDAT